MARIFKQHTWRYQHPSISTSRSAANRWMPENNRHQKSGTTRRLEVDITTAKNGRNITL